MVCVCGRAWMCSATFCIFHHLDQKSVHTCLKSYKFNLIHRDARRMTRRVRLDAFGIFNLGFILNLKIIDFICEFYFYPSNYISMVTVWQITNSPAQKMEMNEMLHTRDADRKSHCHGWMKEGKPFGILMSHIDIIIVTNFTEIMFMKSWQLILMMLVSLVFRWMAKSLWVFVPSLPTFHFTCIQPLIHETISAMPNICLHC